MRAVFLLDLDNTLIDNDGARAELWRRTDRVLGSDRSKQFWELYERVRHELGYVDYLVTLTRWHALHPETSDDLDRLILDLPYEPFRFPASLDVIAALWRTGTPVVLSDGDPTFQPLKVARSGIATAVRGNVLVFEHKEQHLEDIGRLFPADRYVAVDDKAEVLARIKTRWGERVSTVHVLQGKYSDDPYDGPRPDAVIKDIGGLEALVGRAEALRVFLEGASIRSGEVR